MSARRAGVVAWTLGLGAGVLALTFAVGLPAQGCVDPAELVTPPGAQPDAGLDAGPDGGGGGPPAKRTIELRNPYGNVAKVNNLLWDGDFEWETPFADQYGWLTGKAQSYVSYELPTMALGAQCTSGIKCAVLAPKGVLVGVGVSSRGHSLSASFSTRVSTGDCVSAIGAVLFTTNSQEADVELAADDADPAQDGICTYRAHVPERSSALWLYIENTGDADLIVDDAVVEPVIPTATEDRSTLPPSGWAVARASWARPEVLRALLPRDPPPPPVLRALEQRMRARR